VKDSLFSNKNTLNIRGKIMDLSHPRVMGILNITSDSFYIGSRVKGIDNIVARAGEMLQEGADILDIGGYSTRPGARDIPMQEEKKRIIDAIQGILSNFPNAVISVDTFRAEVAHSAIEAGASLVNDISGGTLDDRMFDTIIDLNCPYILMHMRGTPQTMSDFADYEDIAMEILSDLEKKVQALRSADVTDIIIDPGFGFAKTIDQNYALLRNLDYLNPLQLPVLVGLSRKSMIYKTLNTTPEEALNGTAVLHTLALLKGVQILRVHDVKEALEVINLVSKYDAA